MWRVCGECVCVVSECGECVRVCVVRVCGVCMCGVCMCGLCVRMCISKRMYS